MLFTFIINNIQVSVYAEDYNTAKKEAETIVKLSKV